MGRSDTKKILVDLEDIAIETIQNEKEKSPSGRRKMIPNRNTDLYKERHRKCPLESDEKIQKGSSEG